MDFVIAKGCFPTKQSYLSYEELLRPNRLAMTDSMTNHYKYAIITKTSAAMTVTSPSRLNPLLLELPAPSILHPFEEKLPERINGRLTSKAIINVLVLVSLEPEFIGICARTTN